MLRLPGWQMRDTVGLQKHLVSTCVCVFVCESDGEHSFLWESLRHKREFASIMIKFVTFVMDFIKGDVPVCQEVGKANSLNFNIFYTVHVNA